jgi:hypothetical protein
VYHAADFGSQQWIRVEVFNLLNTTNFSGGYSGDGQSANVEASCEAMV